MLNLATQDLTELQNLPKHLSKLEREKRNWYTAKGSSFHKVGDYSPWTIVNRIIKAYVDKPFNDAFSYYCTKVPKYQQYRFLERFENKFSRWYDDYEIDDDGIIRKVKKDTPKLLHRFYSEDYESAWKNRITGHIISEDDYNRLRNGYYWWMYRKHTPKVNLAEYDLVTIKGWVKEFSNTGDPEFRRLHSERKKRRGKIDRLDKKEKEKITYSFLTKAERARKKLMEDNELVRDNHGFDETAFIDKHYHGQKRKWKKST